MPFASPSFYEPDETDKTVFAAVPIVEEVEKEQWKSVVISVQGIKVRRAGSMYSLSVFFRFAPQVLLVGMTTSFPDTARLRRSDCLGSLRKMASWLFGRRLSLGDW